DLLKRAIIIKGLRKVPLLLRSRGNRCGKRARCIVASLEEVEKEEGLLLLDGTSNGPAPFILLIIPFGLAIPVRIEIVSIEARATGKPPTAAVEFVRARFRYNTDDRASIVAVFCRIAIVRNLELLDDL